MTEELRKLLSEWQEELDAREARLAIFHRQGEQFAYQLEYTRITMLKRHIGALADILNTAAA